MQRLFKLLLNMPLLYLSITGLLLSIRATSSAPDIDWLQQYGYSYSDPDCFLSAYMSEGYFEENALDVSLYALAY